MFDVTRRKIIWKKPLEKWFFPTDFQQLDRDSGLFARDDGIYELSLRDGNTRKHPNIDGKSMAVSPDAKKIAFVTSNQLFVASPDGSSKKLVCDIPSGWKTQTSYKGMGERPPLWSGNSDMIILFGESQLLFAQPSKRALVNFINN